MVPLLTQLPALLGVVVGAVATYGFSSWMERSKWRRAQSVRWDEKRLAAYAEYATAVGDFIGIAIRMASARGLPSSAAPIDPQDGLPRLIQAEVERGTKWQVVQLLGDTATISAARLWHQCAWQLEWFAKGQLEGAEEFQAAWENAGIARAKYYAAARASLGVGGGDLPPPPEEPEFIRQARARRSSAN